MSSNRQYASLSQSFLIRVFVQFDTQNVSDVAGKQTIALHNIAVPRRAI
jgi:hypothetical protein